MVAALSQPTQTQRSLRLSTSDGPSRNLFPVSHLSNALKTCYPLSQQASNLDSSLPPLLPQATNPRFNSALRSFVIFYLFGAPLFPIKPVFPTRLLLFTEAHWFGCWFGLGFPDTPLTTLNSAVLPPSPTSLSRCLSRAISSSTSLTSTSHHSTLPVRLTRCPVDTSPP